MITSFCWKKKLNSKTKTTPHATMHTIILHSNMKSLKTPNNLIPPQNPWCNSWKLKLLRMVMFIRFISHLNNPPPNDATTSSSWYIWSHQLSHYSSSLFIFLPLPHVPLITQKNEGGQHIIRRRKSDCLDLTLIFCTFLEASTTISIPPYLVGLFNPSKDMIILY
jgi:hypothetical protein